MHKKTVVPETIATLASEMTTWSGSAMKSGRPHATLHRIFGARGMMLVPHPI